MVNEILQNARFTLGETYKEGRFVSPPNQTYVTYDHLVTYAGPDFHPGLVVQHQFLIYLYEYSPDPDAEKRLVSALRKAGYDFSRSDKAWLNDNNIYETIYEITYRTKGK